MRRSLSRGGRKVSAICASFAVAPRTGAPKGLNFALRSNAGAGTCSGKKLPLDSTSVLSLPGAIPMKRPDGIVSETRAEPTLSPQHLHRVLNREPGERPGLLVLIEKLPPIHGSGF